MFWNGFNGSIWHALLVVSPLGILMYLLSFFSLGKGCHYFFDPKHNVDRRLGDAGDYEPHSKRYQDLAKLAITLSAAAIAFLINVLVGDKPVSTVFLQRIQQVAPIEFGFFGCCIACLVLFMVVQSVWYEEYCHSADRAGNTLRARAWAGPGCSPLCWGLSGSRSTCSIHEARSK